MLLYLHEQIGNLLLDYKCPSRVRLLTKNCNNRSIEHLEGSSRGFYFNICNDCIGIGKSYISVWPIPTDRILDFSLYFATCPYHDRICGKY